MRFVFNVNKDIWTVFVEYNGKRAGHVTCKMLVHAAVATDVEFVPGLMTPEHERRVIRAATAAVAELAREPKS
jgi:hypothetical protein